MMTTGKRDTLREIAETLVFVIVLVLVMKLFVVDAYVIPTGSMGETLYGYKKFAKCEECGHGFDVNASEEAEPQASERPSRTVGYCCPNCLHANSTELTNQTPISGDRVIVGKALSTDDREKVVVFKYPSGPQKNQVGTNYIKRLMGLGGETIAVFGGDLYITKALKYDPQATNDFGVLRYPRPKNDTDLWKARDQGNDYGYPNCDEALVLFDKSQAEGFTDPNGFRIFRKSDEQVMVLRRIVYDNEHQSRKLAEMGAPARWTSTDNSWSTDNARTPKTFTHVGPGFNWIRYRHLLPADFASQPNMQGWFRPTLNLTPQLVTNFLGYNGGFTTGDGLQASQKSNGDSKHWVGDLMVECETITGAATEAVVLELSKGTHRYRVEIENGQARFKMFPGQIETTRPDGNLELTMNRVAVGDKYTLFTKPVAFSPGKHQVRFANIDTRLRLWIDEASIDLGEQADYKPPAIPFDPKDVYREGWTEANDINEPVSVGATGGVTFGKLKIYRDNFYVNTGSRANPVRMGHGNLNTYYVHPGHYLCLGDNSAQSSDGREWGLVPQRLMLGKAVFVFLPISRIGFIK